MLAAAGGSPFAGGARAESGPVSRAKRLRPGVFMTSPAVQ